MMSPRFSNLNSSRLPANMGAGGGNKDGDHKMNSGSREVTISSDTRIKRDDSYESLKSGDDQETIKRKLQQKQKRQSQQRQDHMYRSNTDWMSTVGAGVEPSIFLNHH